MSRKWLAIIIFLLLLALNILLTLAYFSQPVASGTSTDLNGVAWRPDDSFALLVGERGTVLKYNGESFSDVPNVPTSETLWDVAWAPDGRHALIVGGNGTILLYDNFQLTDIQSGSPHALLGATWLNNTVAYIVGGLGTVYRLEEESLSELPLRTNNNLMDIEWYHKDGYGLIVGENGLVLKEFGTHFIELESGTASYLWKVSWRPYEPLEEDEALIVGEDGTAITYNGQVFKTLDTGFSNGLTDISWRYNGDTALIVGEDGLLLGYDGKDFSKESSATSGYLGGVDWRADDDWALLVGGNGVVRRYPNMGLSPEMIVIIWYGELIFGMVAVIVLIIDLFSAEERRVLLPKSKENAVEGEVKIGSSVDYNRIYLFYNVKIKNNTSYPISDITVKPFLSNELFLLDEDTKKIPLVRPNDMKTVKFWLKPNRGVSGKTDIVGRVLYYDPENDSYKDRLIKPKEIKAVWPVLTDQKIEPWRWEVVANTLLSIEKNIPNIPLSGKECSEFAIGIVTGKNMYGLSSTEEEDEGYMATARFYGLGSDNEKYGLEVRSSAQEKDAVPSHLTITIFAEDNASLVGMYHTIFDDINAGLEDKKRELTLMHSVEDFKSKIREMGDAEAEAVPPEEVSPEAPGTLVPQPGFHKQINVMRKQIKSIEKEKLGVDSKYKSLYELDELYAILAEDLVKRKVLDIRAGEEIVLKRLDKKQLEDIKRFGDAYDLLCEAETSESVLSREDFPSSGKKAILLVYFNAVEVYVRGKLKELIPKSVTILLGENHGHINTRKKDWEKIWFSLSLGSLIHVINNNRYLFLKNDELWDRKVETLMHQVRELRNTVAHPSKTNPKPELVRDRVYSLFKMLPGVLKEND